jgi:hypothetical protein
MKFLNKVLVRKIKDLKSPKSRHENNGFPKFARGSRLFFQVEERTTNYRSSKW